MITSESIEKLSKAYTEAASKLLNIAKDSKGHNYKYTSLEKLIEHTKPILAEYGLAILQVPTGNGVITRLLHSSGEYFEQELSSDIVELRGMNIYQSQGSQITYLRRYGWAAICGIASDDDMDAQGEQVQPQAKQHSNFTPDKVSASQVKLIQTRLSKLPDRESNEAALKKHYKIESWNDLPAQSIQGLLDWFEKNGV